MGCSAKQGTESMRHGGIAGCSGKGGWFVGDLIDPTHLVHGEESNIYDNHHTFGDIKRID